jgi:hypothetical protein
MKVYITEMLRLGDPEENHYIVGAFSTREQAELSGDVEKTWRANKYEYQVTEVELDVLDDDYMEKLKYHLDCTG